VVLVFHGYGGTAAGAEAGTGFSLLAERRHFIAVYPQGLLLDGQPFWASAGPVDEGIDELPFVSALLDDLQQHWCVDAHRIYVTGFSNGGGMTGFLACRLASRIAAFAPFSGNYYALPGGCHPSRPLPILVFHGTADTVVPYNGISAQQNPQWPLPPIPETLRAWAERDGCARDPAILMQTTAVTVLHWISCHGDGAVIHYRIEGGGHSIPPTIGSQPTNELVWSFFQVHQL
jgi:polyhydroxybutyrate depolymerase